MGVKLQLVLGSILLCSLWISSSTSIEINSPKPQEHQNDDKNSNVIEKQPKTETEINYVNKNTPTNFKTNSETKDDPLEIEPISNNFEKQNEVEKVTSVVDGNVIKKDASPIGREGTGRSIDIEKYISPEFQNNEYTLPVSSDTEKYLDVPFSSKTSTRLSPDFDHTTSKTSMFNKFTEPVQKLEQEFEYHHKSSDHDHDDFGDDHIDMENDHEDDDEQEQENEDHERDHYLDHENEDNIDDMTVDKMVERSESVPTNISMGWEMKISKDDPDKNNNLKSFTVFKYKKVDYVKHFNDTKVFLNEPKGDSVSLNTTTIKPLTTTTRKNNLLTKPPMEQNNSYLLSNKIETETIKAINLATTELPNSKKTKGDEGSSTKEQINQESQLTVAVTPSSKLNPSETVTNRSSTNEMKKASDDNLETIIKYNKEEQSTTATISNNQEIISNATTEKTNRNNEITKLNGIKSYQTTTIGSLSSQQATAVAATNENKQPTTVEIINPFNTTTSDTTLSIEPLTPEITTSRNTDITTNKIMKSSRETTIENLTADQTIPKTTEKLPLVSVGTKVPSTVQPLSSEFFSIPESTTPEDSKYPNTTEFPREDIYLGTDVTTTTDADITTEFEVTKLTEVRSFKTKSTMPQVTNAKVNKASTETASSATDVPPNEGPSTVSDTTPGGTTETSTADYSTNNFSEIQAESTTESEEFTTISEIPPEITTKTVTEATEYLAYTGRVSEIMSDGTTIMPEISTEKEIPSTKFLKTESVTENKVTSAVTTTTTTSMPASEAITTEVNFVHVETVGTNQTTFIPETLSPNFNYPIESIDNRNRAVPDTTLAEATTVDDTEDTTNTSSTENIVNDDDGGNKGKIAAIVISTVGAVCLVILAGLLYIMKRRQGKFNYKQRCRPVSLDDYSVDNMSAYNSVRRKGLDRQSKRSYGNPAFEDPSVPSHPLNFPALAKFATIVEDMKAEFEEIPQISARASELPDGCEIKNRYANVIPLPETRVYLKTVEGVPNSDYINANYVTGPKKTRGYYIACQAPKQNTVDDFWRMIWEQQCRVVLMITHLFENGVEKCADYLPPSEVLDCHRLFGDFQITLKKREAKEKYIISSIQLKNMVSNSWRDITHFWYLGWPEKGIPSEANSLIAFLIEARSYMKASTLDKDSSPNDMRNDPSQNELNPVVVHCSPGTGRTGVVIACDIAIREFEKTRLVDIPKIVYKIRRDRANAVQTKEQYMFIYKVISLYATKLTGGALDSF